MVRHKIHCRTFSGALLSFHWESGAALSDSCSPLEKSFIFKWALHLHFTFTLALFKHHSAAFSCVWSRFRSNTVEPKLFPLSFLDNQLQMLLVAVGRVSCWKIKHLLAIFAKFLMPAGKHTSNRVQDTPDLKITLPGKAWGALLSLAVSNSHPSSLLLLHLCGNQNRTTQIHRYYALCPSIKIPLKTKGKEGKRERMRTWAVF